MALPKKSLLMPPTYLLASIGLMIMVGRVWPVKVLWVSPWIYLGVIPLVAGFALAFYCSRLFGKHKTAIRPFEESTVLVAEGPYRWSRNPIYIGLVLVLIGVGILLGAATPWIVLPLFVWTLYDQFIAREEAMLAQKFGVQYSEYCKRVRRWV